MSTAETPMTSLSMFMAMAVWSFIISIACAQGTPPLESVSKMQIGDGLEVQLIASEPIVRQPVAIEFDDRGRLWVVQYLQYPNPAELKRVQVDRYSRTKYDRVPLPPPHGPIGADRISILEDSDGDGRLDRAKDFVQGLNLASGIAFGHGGVFVLNVPYLLFYADRDRDDVPDGHPEVLLTGFGMEDAHSVANSLTWGPDGWLYGCQGSTVTANIRGIEFQQGVWRYHPVSKSFELFCEGGGNSWGLDFDRHGNLLYSTNYGGHVLLHAAQGGYFIKSFAKHGELHNPHSYGYLDHAPHVNFQGGHVTVGGVVYQAELLPSQFRNKYIAGDLLGHNVFWHHIQSDKSSVMTSHGGTILHSEDSWFAPTDVTVGPDGAVYVADWYDRRTAHPDPDADWDRSNGRVYRIVPAGSEKMSLRFDISKSNDRELLAAHEHPNQWHVRRSRMELIRRYAGKSRAEIENVIRPLVERLSSDFSSDKAIEYLWTLYCLGGFDESLAVELLGHSAPEVRTWVLRFLGDAGKVSDNMAHILDGHAEREQSILVRHQLASTAARLPAHQAMPIINANINRDIDIGDDRMCLLWWWAIERHSVSGRAEVMKRFLRPTLWKSKLGSDFLLPRLIRRYSAEDSPEGYRAVSLLINSAPDDRSRVPLWKSIRLGLQEQSSKKDAVEVMGSPERNDLIKLVKSHWTANQDEPELFRLAIALHIQGAIELALQRAFDVTGPISKRIEYMEVVATSDIPKSMEVQDHIAIQSRELFQRMDAAKSPLRRLAVRVLGKLDNPNAGEILLLHLIGNQDAALNSVILDNLLAKESTARSLLRAVASGQLQASSVTVEQVRRIGLFNSSELDDIVTKLWGRFQPTAREEKLAEVRRLNNDLRAGSGNMEAGKKLFDRHCASCHQLFGEGKKVGPDLTTSNRQDREYLLISLVDPSGAIRKEYLSVMLQTHDGRVLTGFPIQSDESTLTLVNSRAEPVQVARSEIAQMKESNVSIMPEDLYRVFSPEQLRDLFSYLQRKP